MAKKSSSNKDLKVLCCGFNEIMEEVGWLGKFALRLYVIMYLTIIYAAMNIAAAVFIVADVSYHCQTNDEVIHYVEENCHLNWTDAQTALTIPEDENKLYQCKTYTSSSLMNSSCSYWNSTENTTLPAVKCSKWQYNTSVFYTSAVIDFELICDNKWQKDLSQFLLMFGIFIGATICGIASDRWGRRTAFICSFVILATFSILTSVMRVFWMFVIARLFVGVGAIGLCISGVVYAMEVTSVRHRAIVNQLLQATFSFAFMLLALIAYLERRWVFLNLYLSLPLLLLLPLYLFCSVESPRWLLSRNEHVKAIRIMRRMATVNSRNLDAILSNLKEQQELLMVTPSDTIAVEEEVVEPKENRTTLELFRNPTLRLISLVLFYNWFTATCIYYGLMLYTPNLIGSVFLNFFLGGLVEIPANFGVMPVIHLWGRRPVICLSNLICGISLFCMMLVPQDMVAWKISLFLIGKFGVTATFSCIYLYSSELYPTPLRGNGLGICSGCSRLGGIISLLIVSLKHINPNLPFAVFGCIASLAGFLIVLLPETRGTRLPETIEDTVRLHKHREVTLLKQFVPSFVRKSCT